MRKGRSERVRCSADGRALLLVLLLLALAGAWGAEGSATAAGPGSEAVRQGIRCGLNVLDWTEAVLANRCPLARSGAGQPDKAKDGPRAGGGRMRRRVTRGASEPEVEGTGSPTRTTPAGAGTPTSGTGRTAAAKVEGKPGSGSPPTTASEAEVPIEAKPVPKPPVEAEALPPTDAEAGSESEGGAEPPKSEPPESEAKTEPESGSKVEPESESETVLVPPSEVGPGTEPERGGSSEAELITVPPTTGSEKAWFAPTSVWNRELGAAAPTAAESSNYVAELVRQVQSSGAWINTEQYSTPVYTVGPGQPRVAVELVSTSGGWISPTLKSALSSVPIPLGAKPAAGTDGHLVVWQPSSDEMWEFWRLREEGGRWVASFGGAMKNVSTSPGFYTSSSWPDAESTWGATATSLPLLGGLITLKQFESLKIEHALAMAIPDPSSKFVWPAQRSDGWETSAAAIPEGTIFRLPAGLNLKGLGLTPLGLAIGEAAKRYGMVVRDTSACVCLYGEASTVAGATPYAGIFGSQMPSTLLAGFPWSELVAVAPGN